jgi:polyphosphate kinase 2 (PPK2 family)
VLVTRVHFEYIFGENLPEINTVCDIDDDFWQKRFDQINNFEKHLTENGTIVLKFFLNICKGEQAKRLLHRLESPEDNWKFSAGDMKELQLWDKYIMFYEDAINKTSIRGAPWHIIPADDKASCRYIVAKIILERLQLLTDVKEPTLDIKTLASLQLFKDELKKRYKDYFELVIFTTELAP